VKVQTTMLGQRASAGHDAPAGAATQAFLDLLAA
jgi:hypothetical protein